MQFRALLSVGRCRAGIPCQCNPQLSRAEARGFTIHIRPSSPPDFASLNPLSPTRSPAVPPPRGRCSLEFPEERLQGTVRGRTVDCRADIRRPNEDPRHMSISICRSRSPIGIQFGQGRYERRCCATGAALANVIDGNVCGDFNSRRAEFTSRADVSSRASHAPSWNSANSRVRTSLPPLRPNHACRLIVVGSDLDHSAINQDGSTNHVSGSFSRAMLSQFRRGRDRTFFFSPQVQGIAKDVLLIVSA